jgi:hypothetical protein
MRLGERDVLDIAMRVGRREVVQPTAPAAARVMGEYFDLAFVPISDLPPLSSALVWRRRTSNRRLRELIRIARDILRDAQTSAKVSGRRSQQTSPPSQRQMETPQRS